MRNYLALKVLMIAFVALGLSSLSIAEDISKFEDTCKSIGFKKNNDAFGDCVLELIVRNKQIEKEKNIAAQKAYEIEQQNIKLQNEARATELRNQELENRRLIDLQRQQKIATANQRQQESHDTAVGLLYLLNSAAQGYADGQREYIPSYQQPTQILPTAPPRVNCTSYFYGNSAQTNCK